MPHNEDGVGGAHLYMPWWLDNKKLDFPRGYHIELGGGKHSAPAFGFMGGIQRFNGVGGYGKSLKDDYRRFYGATVNFAGRGEMIPNERHLLRDRPERRRHLRHPGAAVPLRSCREHEVNQAKHMQETFREIIHEMGGTPLSPMPTREQRLRARAGRPHHPRGGRRRGWATIRRRRC